MTRKTTWIVTTILLVYFIFTSGLWFWATDCKDTSKITTPFSWALSAEKTGLTGIATQDDINCVDWILHESDQSMKVMGDSNAVFLLNGYMELLPDTWIILGREDRLLTIHAISKVDKGYLFLTDWNTRNERYIEPTDVGLRKSLPLSISNGELVYIGYNGSDQMQSFSCYVEEVYRSGNSVIYKKVEK
jgi:uncharacterized membrane protein